MKVAIGGVPFKIPSSTAAPRSVLGVNCLGTDEFRPRIGDFDVSRYLTDSHKLASS